MKIALLSEKYTPDIGGLAISAERLAHLLADAGHNVHVLAPTVERPASEKETLPHGSVSVTRFGAHKRVDDTLVDWFELLCAEHAREPFDVLHAFFLPQAGFIAAYAGKYLNIPSVVSIRGNDVERAALDPSRFSHVMYAMQNASALTTNAEELARKARAFHPREIFLVPNGVDAELFKPLKKNMTLAEGLGLVEKNNQGKEIVIGFVGELREKKGMETLLTGYAMITKRRSAALLIIGEVRAGDDRKLYDEFVSANPNAKTVVTGYVSHKDLPAYFALMDIFVHPSLRDGLPNAVLEAMACEKVIVATNVGGMKDLLADSVNGLIVNVQDAEGLAARTLEALDSPEKAATISRSARETVLSRFTPEQELSANLSVYKHLGLRI